jgi:hypothetical protein
LFGHRRPRQQKEKFIHWESRNKTSKNVKTAKPSLHPPWGRYGSSVLPQMCYGASHPAWTAPMLLMINRLSRSSRDRFNTRNQSNHVRNREVVNKVYRVKETDSSFTIADLNMKERKPIVEEQTQSAGAVSSFSNGVHSAAQDTDSTDGLIVNSCTQTCLMDDSSATMSSTVTAEQTTKLSGFETSRTVRISVMTEPCKDPDMVRAKWKMFDLHGTKPQPRWCRYGLSSSRKRRLQILHNEKLKRAKAGKVGDIIFNKFKPFMSTKKVWKVKPTVETVKARL